MEKENNPTDEVCYLNYKMDLDYVEAHFNWIKELRENGCDVNFDSVCSGSELDIKTSSNSVIMAKLLMIFTLTERGDFEAANSYISDTSTEIETTPNRSSIEGYRYLLQALKAFLYEKEKMFSHSSDILRSLKDFESLDDKNKAVIYASRGYAMSRWEPYFFSRSLVENFELSSKVDPDDLSYKIGYAIALGRQRRYLKNILTANEVLYRIEDELRILESCLRKPSPVENLARCFIAVLECNFVSTVKNSTSSSEITALVKDTLQKKCRRAHDILEDLYTKVSNGKLLYDQITIMKRMAMCYSDLIAFWCFPEHKSMYIERADALYKAAQMLMVQTCPHYPTLRYQQMAVEHGKFLRKQGRLEDASAVFREAWDRSSNGEALLYYVHCKKHKDCNYNPEEDISAGVKNDIVCVHWRVMLYCLGGDFYDTILLDFEKAVESFMNAVELDPWGEFRKTIPPRLVKWRTKQIYQVAFAEVDFHQRVKTILKERLKNFIADQNTRGMVFCYKKLSHYFMVKRPQNHKLAKAALTQAINVVEKRDEKDKLEEELRTLTVGENESDEYKSYFFMSFYDIENIGSGNFTTVFKAKYILDGKQYAIKAVHEKSILENTIEYVTSLKHKHILVNYFSWIEVPPPGWIRDRLSIPSHTDSTSSQLNSEAHVSNVMQSLTLSSDATRSVFTGATAKGFKSTPPELFEELDTKIRFIQMELCQKSLREFMHNSVMKQVTIHRIFEQCLQALTAIDALSETHGNLTPTNILLLYPNPRDESDFTVKFGDFGLLTRRKLQSEPDIDYRAPELVHGEKSIKADIYSLGVILFEMLARTESENVSNDLRLFKDGKEIPDVVKCQLEQKQAVLLEMLDEEPSRRPKLWKIKRWWKKFGKKVKEG